MKREVFNELKREFIYIGMLFIIFLIIFKILFYKENLIIVFRTVLSIFWLFVLPGYSLMSYWSEKLGFLERFVIGIALAAGITGILSYYLGLAGLDIRYHTIILPAAVIISGISIKNFQKE